MKSKNRAIFLFAIITLALSACAIRIDFGSPTATAQPATSTSAPSVTPPPLRTLTAVSSATPTSQGAESVLIYLIAIGDEGKSGELIGCDDSAVPVSVAIQPTLGVLRAAYNELFKLRGQREYGMSGLVNALHASNLSIGSLAVENGVARVALTGSFSLGGVCDIPRVEAQLRLTAMQFSTVREVDITLNGIPLRDVLSLR